MLIESEGNPELMKKKRQLNWSTASKPATHVGLRLILQNFLLQFTPGSMTKTTLRRRVFNLLCELCGAENSKRWIVMTVLCATKIYPSVLKSHSLSHWVFFWQTTFYWVSFCEIVLSRRKLPYSSWPTPTPQIKHFFPGILSIKWLGVKVYPPDSLLWSRDILKGSPNRAAYQIGQGLVHWDHITVKSSLCPIHFLMTLYVSILN